MHHEIVLNTELNSNNNKVIFKFIHLKSYVGKGEVKVQNICWSWPIERITFIHFRIFPILNGPVPTYRWSNSIPRIHFFHILSAQYGIAEPKNEIKIKFMNKILFFSFNSHEISCGRCENICCKMIICIFVLFLLKLLLITIFNDTCSTGYHEKYDWI